MSRVVGGMNGYFKKVRQLLTSLWFGCLKHGAIICPLCCPLFCCFLHIILFPLKRWCSTFMVLTTPALVSIKRRLSVHRQRPKSSKLISHFWLGENSLQFINWPLLNTVSFTESLTCHSLNPKRNASPKRHVLLLCQAGAERDVLQNNNGSKIKLNTLNGSIFLCGMIYLSLGQISN